MTTFQRARYRHFPIIAILYGLNLPLYNIPTPKLLVCPAQHFTTRPFEAIGPITPCDIWLRWLLGEGAGLPFAKRIRKVLLFARNKLKAGLAPFFPNGFFLGLPHTIRKTASLLTWRGLGKYTQPPPCSPLRGRRKANGVFAILTNSPSPSPTTSPDPLRPSRPLNALEIAFLAWRKTLP